MLIKWRHNHVFLNCLDVFSSCMTIPWTTALSLLLSFCMFDTEDRKNYRRKILPFFVYIPCLAAFLVSFLPWFLSGFFLWFMLSLVPAARDFYQVSFSTEGSNTAKTSPKVLSTATMNVLLGPEVTCKWQNVSGVYRRLTKMATRIVQQEKDHLNNYQANLDKEESVVDRFPRMDVICFQEVHERPQSLALMYLLKDQYPHFVFDISRNNLWNNRLALSSGLMIASRYPITEVSFTPFSRKLGWQNFLCYGVVVVKLDLGGSARGGRVGIVANLHNVAYEGTNKLLEPALDETLKAVEDFKKKYVTKNETVVSESICGDFNLDNMSPCDKDYNKHQLFVQYKDPCIVSPGVDSKFSIGTEMRQLHMMKPEVVDSAVFKQILADDIRRRYYVIDAHVSVQDFDLMVVDPQADASGDVKAVSGGGGRRIDRILFNSRLATVQGLAFTSALSSLTDHIPFILTQALK